MKILHVIDSGGLYGAEIMLLALMVEQQRQGHSPVLCSISANSKEEKEVETKAMQLGLDVEVFPMRPGLNLQGAACLRQFGEQSRADLFHSHGYKPRILLSLPTAFKYRIPELSTIHGWTNTRTFSKLRIYEWLDAQVLKKKDAIVVVSSSLINHSNLVSAGIDDNKLYVIENGVSTEAIPTGDEQTHNDIEQFCKGAFTILAVGRLANEKGISYLVEAFKLVRRQRDDLKLLIIGAGPLESSLRQQVADLRLDEAVLFTGYLDNARQYMKYCDLYMISSLTEGLPITLLEAMSEKLPLVSTAVGGIPGVIQHEIHGLLVPAQNPAVLAEAVERVVCESGNARDWVENAYQLVTEKYSACIMANAYEKVYRDLIPG